MSHFSRWIGLDLQRSLPNPTILRFRDSADTFKGHPLWTAPALCFWWGLEQPRGCCTNLGTARAQLTKLLQASWLALLANSHCFSRLNSESHHVFPLWIWLSYQSDSDLLSVRQPPTEWLWLAWGCRFKVSISTFFLRSHFSVFIFSCDGNNSSHFHNAVSYIDSSPSVSWTVLYGLCFKISDSQK